MIVRLKAAARVLLLYAVCRFQFYDSPIKRVLQMDFYRQNLVFQFYDSPIKRQTGDTAPHDSKRFQFYDSPIKS